MLKVALVCMLGLAAAGVARAGPPVAVYTLNFDDYAGFPYEIPENALPAGHYRVTVSSESPVSLFQLETVETSDGAYYFPNGTYEGGDEQTNNILTFASDPVTEGHAFTDTQMAVIPPSPSTYDLYYFPGELESSTITTVDGELITVLSPDPTGEAVVTVSALPEPAGWAMMLAGTAMVGGAARGGRRRAATPGTDRA